MDSSSLPPWHFYPSLTDSRLRIIARLIADIRRAVVMLHEAGNGDNNWSLGCRVYARTCHAIQKACEKYEWLTIVEDAGLHFVFAIGGVPLRFYRGEPDSVPARTLKRNLPELHAQQASLFGIEPERADDILRISVETDDAGEAERITLVQVAEAKSDQAEGDVLTFWEIDFRTASAVIDIDQQRPGVPLPPAAVLPFKNKNAKKKEDESGGDGA